jgi:hypothetical protein
MKQLINNILPNIRRSINQKILQKSIVGITWYDVISLWEYSFLENNRLVIEANGVISEGKWEILPNDKIIITYASKTLPFTIVFFKQNWLILSKTEGDTISTLFLTNNKDLTLSSMLDELISAKALDIDYISQSNDLYINAKMFNNSIIQIGAKLKSEYDINDGVFYSTKYTDQYLSLKNGIVVEIYLIKKYKIEQGKIRIKQKNREISIGDTVQNFNTNMKSIKIDDHEIKFDSSGKVIKIQNFLARLVIEALAVLVLLIIIAIIYQL